MEVVQRGASPPLPFCPLVHCPCHSESHRLGAVLPCWHGSGFWLAGCEWVPILEGPPSTAAQIRTWWRQEGHV